MLEQILFSCLIFAGVCFVLSLSAANLGSLSLHSGAALGFGAYAFVLLAPHVGTPLAYSAVLIVAAPVGIALGLLASHYRDDAFLLHSYAIQTIIIAAFINSHMLLGGPQGLTTDVMPLSAWSAADPVAARGIEAIGLSACYAVVGAAVLAYCRRRRVTWSLDALRQNPSLSRALGLPDSTIRLAVFGSSFVFFALGGSIFAAFYAYVSPPTFALSLSLLLLTVVLAFGGRELGRIALAIVVIIPLPYVLRLWGLQSSVTANIHQIVYGLALFFILRFRPFSRQAVPYGKD